MYSTHNRSRRSSHTTKYKTIPSKYWNSVIECVEYPRGVYINQCGTPMPDILVHDILCADELPDDQDDIFEHERLEQIEENENLEYDVNVKFERYEEEGTDFDEVYTSYLNNDLDYSPNNSEGMSEGDFSESSEDIFSDSDMSDTITYLSDIDM
jgi:hypothetical protein